MGKLPFLEVQILHSTDPKSKILDFLRKKTDRFKNAHASIINADTDPKIFIEFPSLDSMQRVYSNDSKIVEKFYQLLQDKKEDLHFDFPTSTSNHKSKNSKVTDVDGTSLYLILKCRTNAKDIIRAKYNFTYKIVDLVGIKASFEEVEDGFILFYATEEDFQLTQMDLNNFADIKKWMEKKGVWKDSFGEYLSQTQNWLKTRNN